MGKKIIVSMLLVLCVAYSALIVNAANAGHGINRIDDTVSSDATGAVSGVFAGATTGGGTTGAISGAVSGANTGSDPTGSIVQNIFNQANGFQGDNLEIGNKLKSFISNAVIPIVGTIGNLVFAGVTVILGMKYIWSSAEGKSEVLESLPGFVLAVVFFYLGGSLVNYFTGSSLGGILEATSWNDIRDAIWGIIYLVAQYGSFAGILVLGLRYMFASAEGKAKVKANFGVFAIGLLFVFSASNVVNFIIHLGGSVLK